MYYLSRNFTDQPAVLKFFFMGIFIATSVGLVFNNFIKISLHAMAAGGAATAIILFSYYYQAPFGLFISIALLLAGLICSSRLLVSDHTNAEIYYGLLVGAGCQLISYFFVM
jgi:lipopolysaccharide export LptBFGC system permease protein LptF